MTAPLHAGAAEPGWSAADTTSYGPGYCRYVPGKGMLKVGYDRHQYRWWLQTGPGKAMDGRDGFTDPREAMQDADRLTAMLVPGMFDALTTDELMALYRELVQAYPHAELASVRDDVFGQMEIAALDRRYNGPDPLLFAQAAQLAFSGALAQAMRASMNRGSWLAAPPGQQRGHRTAQPGASPGRRTGATGTGLRDGQARPGRPW